MAKSKVHPAAKRLKLPKGFVRHKGGVCPVDPTTKLRMAILTADHGVLTTEPQQARMHEWEHHKHDEAIGAVVGFEPPK